MNPDIPLLLRPFAGRLVSFIASLVLACVVKGIAIIAAHSPAIAALIDPNQVADFLMIAILAGINTTTNYYHTGYLQPVADAIAAEQEKLKPVPPPTAGFTTDQTVGAIVAVTAATMLAVGLLCSGCANYAGPTMRFSAGYEGIDVGFTLFGRTPIAPVPVTVAGALALAAK